jgi:F0F1-type ATP synthase epsilon subunit
MYPKLHLRVITPTERLLDQEGVEAFACTMKEAGALEIMPGHLPLIGVTEPGTVEYLVGEDVKELQVGTGILDVEKDSVILLVIGGGLSKAETSTGRDSDNQPDRLLSTYLNQLQEMRKEKE